MAFMDTGMREDEMPSVSLKLPSTKLLVYFQMSFVIFS